MIESHWFIAYTRSCQEKNVAAALEARGLKTYVPIRKVIRQWSDRKKVVDQILVPRIVFVHCTEKERRQSFGKVFYLVRYLTDFPGSAKPARVPEQQMRDFIAMVTGSPSEVTLTDRPLQPGDMVLIKEGPFEGRVVELVNLDGKHYVAVRLPVLGAAITKIDIDSVERVSCADDEK